MELSAGRDFSGTFSKDAEELLIVNEALVKKLGWDEPVGKKMDLMGRPGKIIGVVRDFHYESLHKKIAPLVLRPVIKILEYTENRQMMIHYLVLNVSGENIARTLKFIEREIHRV